MNNNMTINKRDNRLLYVLDKALDRFVVLFIIVVRVILPARCQVNLDKFSDHKDMLQNVIGLAFFNFLGGLCVIVTQVKLANYFGASVYGVYSYCLAIGEVGAMFVRYGRNKTMVRDLIQYPEKRDSLVVNTFFLSLTNLVLFLAVTFACHEPLGIEVNWTYVLLILSPCFISLTLDPVYESMKLMSWNSIYNFLQKFAFLAIIWVLFLSPIQVGLLTIGTIIVITWLIICAMEYHEIATQLHIHFLKKIKLKQIWTLYKENFAIFLSCVTGVAYGPVLRLILNNYTNSRSVGIYAAGLQIYYLCLFLNSQISRVGNPTMAEAGKENCSVARRRKLVFRYVIVMFAASLPFALPMLFCPSILTSLLFSAEYSELAHYLPILSFYLMAMAIGIVFSQYMISLRLDKTYFAIYVISAIATLLVALYTIPKYGLYGAFIALCVPHSIGCFCYMLFSLHTLKEKEI